MKRRGCSSENLSNVSTPSSKSFVVKRPSGSMVQYFINLLFSSLKQLAQPYSFISCSFRHCIISILFFSSCTLIGCQSLLKDFVTEYILTERQLENAELNSVMKLSHKIKRKLGYLRDSYAAAHSGDNDIFYAVIH